jgi:hypothetical protein
VQWFASGVCLTNSPWKLLLSLQAVSYWGKAVRASGNSVVELQAVIEKSVVLGLATNTASTSHSLAELMTTYASTLATQVGGIGSSSEAYVVAAVVT